MPLMEGFPEARGLNFFGEVTQVISATQFVVSNLAGQKNNYFQDWVTYVVSKSDGSGNAPQSDFRYCTAYTTNGLFTIDSQFTAVSLSVGDAIYMIHPFLAVNVGLVCIPSNNIKQSDLSEICTNQVVPTLVKSITFTGKAGGARLFVDVRTNGAGIATAYFYKNGAFLTATVPMVNATGIYATFTQDVYGLVAGDVLQVYLQANVVPNVACVRNFKIGYDIQMISAAEFGTDYVYVNQTLGIPGTAWPAGSAAFPSNNLTDAIVIANNKATRKIHFVGTNTLDQAMLGWLFAGDSPTYDHVNLNGFDVTGSTFKWLNVYGATAGMLYAQNCIMGANLPNSIICNGHIYDSPILGIEIPTGFIVITWKCAFGNTIDITGGQLYIIDGVGDLDINSMNGAAPLLNVLRGDSDVLLEAACVSGMAYVTGNNHRITNNSVGTVLFEYTDYPRGDVAINALVTTGVETPLVTLPALPDPYGYVPRMEISKLRIKATDPGINVITVRLYELINGVLTVVDDFQINAGNWNTYFNLMDLFNLNEIRGSQIMVTAEASAVGPYTITGSYMYKSA